MIKLQHVFCSWTWGWLCFELFGWVAVLFRWAVSIMQSHRVSDHGVTGTNESLFTAVIDDESEE